MGHSDFLRTSVAPNQIKCWLNYIVWLCVGPCQILPAHRVTRIEYACGLSRFVMLSVFAELLELVTHKLQGYCTAARPVEWYICPSVSEVTSKGMGRTDKHQTTAKQNKHKQWLISIEHRCVIGAFAPWCYNLWNILCNSLYGNTNGYSTPSNRVSNLLDLSFVG